MNDTGLPLRAYKRLTRSTYDQLAYDLKVSRMTIYSWLCGKHPMPPIAVELLRLKTRDYMNSPQV